MQAIGQINSQVVAQSIAQALRNAVAGLAAPGKQLARMTGKCPRTIRNIMDASNAPSAATLIELMRDFDEVYETVLALAQRENKKEAPDEINRRIEQALNILNGGDRSESNTNRVS